jgi:hypothetical protein
VYIALAEYGRGDGYDDVYALIKGCRVVVRDDTVVSRWDEQNVVLWMGTSDPIAYEVLGEEFQQTFLCLAHPSMYFDSTSSFAVGEWVCINRPGTYWGNVGLVRSLSDSDDEDRITVLLVPRMTDEENQAIYNVNLARPGLMKYLRPHTSDDPPLSNEDVEETWLLGREQMTKDGMLLRSFAPWELRKDMMDGSDLYLVPEQDIHFRRLIPTEDWHLMPPPRDPRRHLMGGERVEVAGHKGVIVGFHRQDPELVHVYSETCKKNVICHVSFIVKQHTEGDTAFSFELNENVVVLDRDYLRQEVKIQLRATAARRYRKESLVSQCTVALLSIDPATGKNCAPKFPPIPTLAQYCGSSRGWGGLQADHRAVPRTPQMAGLAYALVAEASSIRYW